MVVYVISNILVSYLRLVRPTARQAANNRRPQVRDENFFIGGSMAFQIFDHEKDCERCGHKVRARLVRTVAQNGANQVYWWCLPGDHKLKKSAHYIPHEKLREFGIDPDNLPIKENYSGMFPCVVCGSTKTEWHHFAPRHLFNDADDWPGAYLCKPHHTLWHEVVTPDMARRREK